MFTRWGGFVYRRRRWIVALAIVVAAGFGALGQGTADNLSTGGWLDPTSESAQVADRLEADFGGGRSAFIAVFRSTNAGADATSPDFQVAISTALKPALDIDGVTGLTGYAETHDDRFISTKGDAAYVVIGLDVDEDGSIDLVDPVQKAVDDTMPAGYAAQLTGFGPIQQASADLSEKDLVRAETVSLPIAALVLILVFSSLIAAGMPLFVAGLAIPTSIGIINLAAKQTEMSIYVLNIATMLGLALAIDYSLFLTSRFREELKRGRTVEQAVERAVGTAGKAVLFSGVAVAIGLSGLLWFKASGLSSIGLGGAIVVVASVFYSLTFLPAILGMLGHRVNSLSVAGLLRRLGLRKDGDAAAPRGSRWERVAHGVMRRPLAVLLPVLAVLLLVGSPYLQLKQGIPDATVMPPGVASRDAWVALQTEFRAGETTPIVALADTSADPLSAASIIAVRAYATTLEDIDGVDRVEGPFDLKDQQGTLMTPDAVAALYATPTGQLPPDLAAGLASLKETYIRGNTVRLDAISPYNSAEPRATALISTIRTAGATLPTGLDRVQIGGGAALGEDFLLSQQERIPWAVGTTLLASAIILFLLFGSLAIPIKAVLMTLLSLTASFGALVWIFQEGNLHELLKFTPLGYTIAGNPIIMFATLIGLSMDYEVLLLSRIQESYRRTGENAAAVAEGLARTAGVITGAALIMVTVFAAFALADTVTIKSIGVGMALAVLLDATIIRVLLVPATMRLLGDWNWWAPGPLGRLAARFGFSHVEDEEDLAAAGHHGGHESQEPAPATA
ncbi:MAG TPA: MMPL family transporter [Candidatus Limnocylindrales bacterium]|nr:MMPL family transporter [Candidatus Limnocylindrales bacterium]